MAGVNLTKWSLHAGGQFVIIGLDAAADKDDDNKKRNYYCRRCCRTVNGFKFHLKMDSNVDF